MNQRLSSLVIPDDDDGAADPRTAAVACRASIPAYPPFAGLPDLPALRTLYALDHWVAWKYVLKPGKPKPDKVPINPATGAPAKTNDPTTWGSWQAAEDRTRRENLPGVGFVLAAEDGLCGIDLDNCRDVETEELAPWAAEVVALAETYVEVSPSGRGLRLFALGKPTRTIPSGPDGVEIYGEKHYLTATGRHLPDTPDAIRPAPETMALLQARVEVFRGQKTAASLKASREPATVAAVAETPENVAQVRAMLSAIDRKLGRGPERDIIHGEWLRVVFAILATRFDCAVTLARDWSAIGSKWDEAAFDALVRSFKPDGGITIGTLVYIARQHGYDGSGLAQAAPNEGTISKQLEHFLAYLPMHKYIHTPTGALWPAASVDRTMDRVQGVAGPGEDGKAMQPSLWLDRHRPVVQMTWAPGEPQVIRNCISREGVWVSQPGSNCFNSYEAPIPSPDGDPGHAGPWLELVRTLYPDEADHIIAWCAHRVQRPGEKINHALVLGGDQGIGKETLLEPLVKAVGPGNFHEISPSQLTGRFNTYVKSVVLRISEVHDLGDMTRPQYYERSKTLITTPPETIRIDEKHINEYHVKNCCGVIMTTNHKAGGIYLPPDDRRHFVAWSACQEGDIPSVFFSQLWAWYNRGGFAHVDAFLRAYDLSSFNPKEPPPKTSAFYEIVAAGRAPEEAELGGVIDRLGDPAAFTLKQLEQAAESGDDQEITNWLRDRKNRRTIPYRLERCGYVSVRNASNKEGYWPIQKTKVSVYARADLSDADRKRAATALIQEQSRQRPKR